MARLLALLAFSQLFCCAGVSTPLGLSSAGAGQAGYVSGSPRADAMAHHMAAAIHMRRRQYDAALSEAQKAVQLQPDEPVLLTNLAVLFEMSGARADALQTYERLARITPDNPVVWSAIGRLRSLLGQRESAAEAYQKVLDLGVESEEAYLALIQESERSNDYATQLEIFQKLVDIVDEQERLAKLYALIGQIRSEVGDYQGAYEALERSLELQPQSQPARFFLSVVALEVGELDRAEELLTALTAADRENPAVFTSLASALGRQGRYEEAVGYVAKAQALDPNPIYGPMRAFLLTLGGQAEQAAQIVPPPDTPLFGTIIQSAAKRAAGEDPSAAYASLRSADIDSDLEIQTYLPEMIYFAGETEAAGFLLTEIGKAREAGAAGRPLELVRGRALMAIDSHRAAEAVLRSAIETYGPHKWNHFYLGTLYYEELEEVDPAIEQLEACLALDENDPDVLNYLGYLYAEQNIRLETGKRLVERALEIIPDSGAYLDSLGWIYYRMGDADKAAQLIEEALRNMPADDPILRDHLGDAYLLQGDAQRAAEEWKRALILDPDMEGVREKIERHGGD